jgi:RNase P/RNase MRP subunit POP5
MDQRRRYVAFKVTGDGGLIAILRLVKKLKQEAEKKPSIKLVEYDHNTGFGLLRCGHLETAMVKDGLVGSSAKEKIKILGVSGTVKAAKRKFAPSGVKG